LDEPSSVERLWEEFKLKASADARERLILHYAPLVKYVAGRVSGDRLSLVDTLEDRAPRTPSPCSSRRS
jgi:RNA polymerase sigma factor FliA